MHWQPLTRRSRRAACIRLAQARLCPACEVIFEGKTCPACASECFVPVSKWIPPLQPAAPLGEQRELQTGSQRSATTPSRDPVSLLLAYLHRAGSPRTKGDA